MIRFEPYHDELGLVAALLDSDPRLPRTRARVIAPIESLFRAYQRLASGSPQPGDRVAVLRGLIRVIQQAGDLAGLVWLAVQLGRTDENALLPWQAVLRDRPQTQHMRQVGKGANAFRRRATTLAGEKLLFFRVLDYVEKHGCPLNEAFRAIAAGLDGPFGLRQFRAKFVSPAKVRAAYQSQLAEAKRLGFVPEAKGMLMGIMRNRPLPPAPKKGRPKSVKPGGR